jgi:hypothetical protein
VRGGLQPVDAGHADIEQHDVGPQPVGQLERLAAVGRRTDDLVAADLAEQAAQTLACRRLVVRQQYLHAASRR